MSERGTLPYIIHHHMPRGYPPARLELAESEVDREDIGLCERLLTAFEHARRAERQSVPPGRRPAEGIWEMFKHEFHGPLWRLIEARDPRGLAEYLRNGMRTTATHGLGPGTQVFEAASSPEVGPVIATIIVDRTIALAEALAVLPCENPEQGRWGQNLYEDLEAVVRGIEGVCGYDIGTPRVFGAFGVSAGGRLIHVRTPDNVYTCHRMDVLLGGLTGKAVLEIGAGFGGTAVCCARRGVARFTIVDLPLMNMIQGYFLIKVLGPDAVTLFGESRPGATVRVLPYWEMVRFGEGEFDLTMNQDSLPELPLARAREYIEAIPHCTRSYFYSVNQEAMGSTDRVDVRQLVVPQLVAGNVAYRRVARHAYWVRRGYVEEVYALRPRSADVP